jgi:hypothetical protein
MNYSEGNFLEGVKQLITGTNTGTNVDGGFLADQDISVLFATSSTNLFLTSTAGSTIGPIFITRDYDFASDQNMLRLIGSTSTAGNPTITFSAALTIWNPNSGTSSTTSTTATQTSSTALVTNILTNVGVELSGNNLQYGDVINVTLSTSGGNFNVVGASQTYSSCLVAYADYSAPSTSVVNGLAVGPNSVVTETVNGSTYELRTR